MKRVFEIEFPDELGEMWMNRDNLMICINAYCDTKDGRIKTTDVTDSVVHLCKDQSLPDPLLKYEVDSPEWNIYIEAQLDILRQGWKKLVECERWEVTEWEVK